VVNAGTADKDVAWLGELALRRPPVVAIVPRPDLALIAVQGPAARSLAWTAIGGLEAATAGLRRFQGAFFRDWFVARTGYTGEDGFELMVPAPLAERTWQLLAAAGVRPCGLGARDTLRLEAGMALYGHEMDETTSPLEAGLAWTVDTKTDRDFVGRAALAPTARWSRRGAEQGAEGAQAVRTAHGDSPRWPFAPTLNRSIALARARGVSAGDTSKSRFACGLRARVVTRPLGTGKTSSIDLELSKREALR
jgi:aminomethyltransferase